MKKLNILLIDAAQKNFVVQLASADKIFVSVGTDGKSDSLVNEISLLFQKAKIQPKDLDFLAVGLGPGSFTGIRVAVSVAKGLAVVIKPKIVVFDSFERLAYNVKETSVVVVDGFSKFVFAKTSDGERKCVEIDELKKLLNENTKVIANKEVFEKIGKGKHVFPRENLIELAKEKIESKQFVKIDDLVPIYLRASQAELLLEEKNKKK